MSSPTIIISNDTTINDFGKLDTYYINNSNSSITITIGVPKTKYNLHFYLLDPEGYTCAIYIKKGYFYIETSQPELHLVYNGKWIAINNSPVPFQDDEPNQTIDFNLFNNAEAGKEFILIKGASINNLGVLSDLTDASSQKMYKIDKDLIIMNCPNYQVTEDEDSNGVGALIVYEKLNGGISYNSIINRPYKITQSKQGRFSTHFSVLHMEGYDLLIVSAPDLNIVYIYSYRKNIYNQFFFYFEFEHQISSSIPIQQIKTIDNVGYIYLTESLFLHKIVENTDTQIVIPQLNNIQDIEIQNKKLFALDLSDNIQQFDISGSSIVFRNTIVSLDVSGSNFGKQIIQDGSNNLFVISDKNLFQLDLSGTQIYTEQFNEDILSFDVYTDLSNNKNILVLLDSELINVYLIRNSQIIMSDYLSENNALASKIKFDTDGKTFFLSYPEVNVLDEQLGDIESMGYIVRYDLFLDTKEIKLLSFPQFNIENQLLIERNDSNLNFETRWLEQTFLDTSGNKINLVSNTSKSSRNIKPLEAVHFANDVVLNLKTNENQYLVNYPMFKIYSDLENGLINNNQKYLRINSLDKL